MKLFTKIVSSIYEKLCLPKDEVKISFDAESLKQMLLLRRNLFFSFYFENWLQSWASLKSSDYYWPEPESVAIRDGP